MYCSMDLWTAIIHLEISEVNGVGDNSTGMVQLRPVCWSRHREDAVALQNAFASYFNGPGNVPWQWDHVRRTSYQPVVD